MSLQLDISGKFLVSVVSMAICLVAVGCEYDPTFDGGGEDERTVGFSTVELNATRTVLRTGEARLGNLVADAIVRFVEREGRDVDLALMNAGAIRFSTDRHPDGIYPAGELTNVDVTEMLPFGNTVVLVRLTGAELESALERSVSALSDVEGRFLQVSNGVQIVVNPSGQPQIIDVTQDPPVLVEEGTRIESIQLPGRPISPSDEVVVATNDFIADGGDGYVAFANVPADRKTQLGVELTTALEQYLLEESPVSPAIEGRIQIR